MPLNDTFHNLDFNEEFARAFEVLEHSRQHVFVTGKAGTGKSTLLQYFRQKTAKDVALLAPTGVAAINIKGQTIHSFFGFKPDVTPETVGDIPVRKRKRKMYQQLEAVIIDEISMVRADLLDCVDIFLRLYGPHVELPFGGVQMIFFGDLFQLPPVVGRGEEDIFKTHYTTPFFFSAKVFEALDFRIMQLNKIYRQKDEHFIRLLNAVRDDSLEHHHWESLNRRFKPDHQLAPGDFYIVLTTTNVLAEKVNNQRLQNLSGAAQIYQGAVSGTFDRKSLPAPEVLELKAGAQVMMLSNDPDKRWVNGSLGKITAIASEGEGEDVVKVKLESGGLVDVKKHTWEIYQYYFDEKLNALASKIIGHFTQYPLKLAWAVTIHKSQGQTFERVIIDVGWGTFSHGQMYVALSRCTTLEGIVLKQPLSPRHILMDERVVRFMKTRAFSFLFLALFLFFSAASFAQANPNSWEEDNSGQPYIGLLTETDTTIHDDWSFDEDYHARVKIQQEAAKSLGQWPVYYNKSREEITNVEAFVETPDGRKFEATDIKDLPAYDASPLYSDMRLKLISLPKISVGAVIDVRVQTRVLREEIPNQFWDEVTYPSIPTKYARSTFIFPAHKPILFRAYRNTAQPIIEKNGGMIKYSYVFENTSYSEDEDFMPPSDEIIGVISLSSLSDWGQVADWYRDLINKNTVDDPELTARALALVSGKTTVQDKARAILEFIQDDFRYVSMSLGDHTVGPHPTNEVFHNRYGDGIDLALLARQMFKIAGIDADICLFSGEFNGDPRHGLPNPSAFDYEILRISLNGQKYFVDPQARGFDLGELPSSYDNAHVLAIGPQSYHFDHVPVADESFHSVISSSDIFLAEDGSADFDVRVKMPVEASQDFKSSWNSTNDSGKRKFFDNLQATFAQGGKITERSVKGLENRYGPVEFDFKYSSPDAYSLVNDMILVRETQQGDLPDFAEDKRRYPIFVPTNSLIKSRNTYHVPDGLKVEFVPASYDLSNDFMQVSTKYTRGDNTVTVESIYRLKRALIPRQEYGAVKKFRNEVYKKNEQYLVLRKRSNITPEAKTWIRSQ